MSETRMYAELEALAVPVGKLENHPENYNIGDVELIAESLRVNKMYKPLIYQRSTGHVLAGNHTLKAARKLGWETVAAIGIEPDADTARKILAIDNQSAKRSTFDEAALLDLLQAVPDLEATGFSDDDLEDLLASQEEPIELPPAETKADWAETAEETAGRAEKVTNQSTLGNKGVSEIVLILPLDEKEDFIRDLDGIAKHMNGSTRAAAAARAARIALTVLDAAETNAQSIMDWQTLLDIADTSMEDLSA